MVQAVLTFILNICFHKLICLGLSALLNEWLPILAVFHGICLKVKNCNNCFFLKRLFPQLKTHLRGAGSKVTEIVPIFKIPIPILLERD